MVLWSRVSLSCLCLALALQVSRAGCAGGLAGSCVKTEQRRSGRGGRVGIAICRGAPVGSRLAPLALAAPALAAVLAAPARETRYSRLEVKVRVWLGARRLQRSGLGIHSRDKGMSSGEDACCPCTCRRPQASACSSQHMLGLKAGAAKCPCAFHAGLCSRAQKCGCEHRVRWAKCSS